MKGGGEVISFCLLATNVVVFKVYHLCCNFQTKQIGKKQNSAKEKDGEDSRGIASKATHSAKTNFHATKQKRKLPKLQVIFQLGNY